jgi:hypothetical protein
MADDTKLTDNNQNEDKYTDIFGWKFRKKPEDFKAPYVKTVDDDASFTVSSSYYGQHSHSLQIESAYASEVDSILRYRETSLYPEVDSAIADICNEAITGDDDSSPVKIVTDDLKFSESIKKTIEEEFHNIIEMLDFNYTSYETFRKFYVDGRLSYLKIIDPKNPKAGIQELRYIPSINIKKFREEKTKKGKTGLELTLGYEEYYLYTKESAITKTNTSIGIKLTNDSVAYVTSGLIDEKNNVVYSFLQKALKPTNQLRLLEDAVLIYTLARAPQRRIFYVDVGNMPRNKAEEYLKNVMNRFKNKMVYDAITGEIKDSQNTISMMEDFWLPRQGGNRSTEISTLDGAQINSQIDILDYFRKKLYMSLNVPVSRITWEPAQGFSIGRPSEISREEIKFAKFISRLRTRFNGLFYDILRTQLLLKQIITEDDWQSIKEQITFDYVSDSHFKELKDADLLKERISMLELITPYVGTYFSQEFVWKKVLNLNDEDINNMKAQMEQESEELQQLAIENQSTETPEQEETSQIGKPADGEEEQPNWQDVPQPPTPISKAPKKK